MADSARARRLAKRIAATVTPDLREATVFYTVYGDEGEITGTAAALTSATGVLRSAVGQQTGIKFTPTLVFKLDTVPENAYRINELLAAARSADAEVAERAAGASYAGEPDPYKVPRVEHPVDDDDLVAHAGARSEYSNSAGEFDDVEFDDGEFDDPNASVGHQVR